MEKIKLTAKKRTAFGRKVKQLRKKGILPANIYGAKIESLSVEVPLKEFQKVYREVGETRIVDLSLDSKLRPVLIHNVQLDPLTRTPLHTDFYQVDLKQKVKTKVPIELVGESPAVAEKTGLLLQLLSEVEIEALPGDLPKKISLDVGSLSQIDQELKVSDLEVAKGVTILTDNNLAVVKVGELVSKEAEEVAREEEAAAAAAKEQAAAQAEVPSKAAAPASEEKPETPAAEAEKAGQPPDTASK